LVWIRWKYGGRKPRQQLKRELHYAHHLIAALFVSLGFTVYGKLSLLFLILLYGHVCTSCVIPYVAIVLNLFVFVQISMTGWDKLAIMMMILK
jgi:hypothetical protein